MPAACSVVLVFTWLSRSATPSAWVVSLVPREMSIGLARPPPWMRTMAPFRVAVPVAPRVAVTVSPSDLPVEAFTVAVPLRPRVVAAVVLLTAMVELALSFSEVTTRALVDDVVALALTAKAPF